MLIKLYSRMAYKGKLAPEAETFMDGLAASLPTPKYMIETMCLLFTGSVPEDVKDNTVSVTHEGICVSINAWASGNHKPRKEETFTRQRAGVNVRVGTMHLHGRVFDRGYWVPAFGGGGGGGLSLTETFELLRTKPESVQQIVKPSKGDMMFSSIRAGTSEVDRASKLGWLVL